MTFDELWLSDENFSVNMLRLSISLAQLWERTSSGHADLSPGTQSARPSRLNPPAHARTGDMDFGLSISRTYRPLGRFCLTLSRAQRVKVRAALSIECNGFPIDNSRADRQR